MDKKENIETAKTGEIRPRIDWSKWDAIFSVALVAFVIFIPLGGFFYLCGRFSPYLIFLIVWFIYPAIGALLLFFVAVSIKRSPIVWERYMRRKKVIKVVQIGIPIVFIALFAISVLTPIETYLWPPGYKPFTYGFRERIRSKADIGAIRNWLKTLSKEDCTGEAIHLLLTDSALPRIQWPDSVEWSEALKVCYPGYVTLDLDKNGNPKVRLTWGGPFDHWGVEIGMEDMEIPASDFSRYGEYRLPLEPGAYIWYELQ